MSEATLLSKHETVVRGALGTDLSLGEQDAWLNDAAACVQRNGIIIIEDAIPRRAIEAVLTYVQVQHDVHLAPGQKKLFRTFQTDPLRAQLPIALDGPIANPEFFAAPSALKLARKIMGDDFVIGELGMVVSHPGAKPQEAHRDTTPLFDGLEIEIELPTYSLTTLIPLIDVTLDMGPTEFWPGSHRCRDEAAVTAVPPQRMALKTGSIVMLDSRLVHRGGAHIEGPVRPFGYVTFQRHWLSDKFGYEHKPQVRITPAMLHRLPEAYQPLVKWALHLNRTDSFQEFVYRWAGRIRRRIL